MKFTQWLCLALVLIASSVAGKASTLLYTFGGDSTGAPTSLNSMDPASAASVTAVQTPVGDGSTGFNGGLVAANNLLYGIGNDSNGVATLYSLQFSGLGLTPVSSGFNNAGDAAGVVFQNGLTAVGNTFYAIGAGTSSEALYQIGAGSASQVQVLDTLGGTYAGLAWDAALGDFYAIIAGGTSAGINGDYLVQFAPGGSVSVVADLTLLDGAPTGTHLGGLADAGSGILYDIYTNPVTFTGELERIDVNGGPSASTLYDSQIPLAQNAGIAVATAIPNVPEPATSMEIGAGLVMLGWTLRRAARRGKRGQQ